MSLADARGKLPVDKLLEMRLDGVAFDHLASVYEQYTGKIAVENLRPSWLIFAPGFRKSRFLSMSKRALDVTAGAVVLVLAVPVMALIAMIIRLTSTGPIRIPARVVRHGRIFVVHSFARCFGAEAATARWPSR